MAATGGLHPQAPFFDSLTRPDVWFTHEVIVRGRHIEIRVDGRNTLYHVATDSDAQSGHLALQANTAWSRVQFRKVEIKRLDAASKN